MLADCDFEPDGRACPIAREHQSVPVLLITRVGRGLARLLEGDARRAVCMCITVCMYMIVSCVYAQVGLACVVGVCISFFGFRAKVLLGPTDSMVRTRRGCRGESPCFSRA
jgi:hypothetical protein